MAPHLQWVDVEYLCDTVHYGKMIFLAMIAQWISTFEVPPVIGFVIRFPSDVINSDTIHFVK